MPLWIDMDDDPGASDDLEVRRKAVMRANTYCMRKHNGQLCHTVIPTNQRLCEDCRKRGHEHCESPNAECTCGFSQLFWADVEARKYKNGG